MGVCNCSVLLYVTLCPFLYCNHLNGRKRELVALLFSVMLRGVFLGLTSNKERHMCHAQANNAVTPIRLQTATSRSQDK